MSSLKTVNKYQIIENQLGSAYFCPLVKFMILNFLNT